MVEVSPPYDHAEVTAFLANRVVIEALSGIAWWKRVQQGDETHRPEEPLLERGRNLHALRDEVENK